MTAIPIAFIFKFVPDKICPEFGKKRKNPMVNDEANVMGLRKNRSSSFSLRQPGSVGKDGR
jgi:hypothetical protein